MASQIGEQGEAVTDLKKELALYPDNERLYGYLVQQQVRQDDRVGATETAQAWGKGLPGRSGGLRLPWWGN